MTKVSPHHRRSSYAARRRGSVYIIVLATAMMIVVIGVSSVMAMRAKQRAGSLTGDTAAARYFARAGVEMALAWMRSNSNWRSAYPHGSWATGVAVGNGSFDVSVTDPLDSDLADDAEEDVLVTATGYCGTARQKIAVTVRPNTSKSISSLHTVAVASGNLTNTGSITLSGAIAANGNFSNSGTINGGGIQVSGTYSNSGTVNAWLATSAAPREMPSISDIVSRYSSQATDISILVIPQNGLLSFRMKDVLLSSTSNPFGLFTNPNGVYRINCLGFDLEIRDCRIVGTLILVNPGSGSQIRQGMIMEPARSDYPTLIISGNGRIGTAATLSESVTNFNPAALPYNGVSNTNVTDVFTSIIKGVVVVSGNLTLEDNTRVYGNVVTGGWMALKDTVALIHDPRLMDNPPTDFQRLTRYMTFVPGSWKRLVD